MRQLLVLAAVLTIAHIAVAKDYALTAKIKTVSAESSSGRGRVGYEQVRIRSVSRHTAVQIGSRVYTTAQTPARSPWQVRNTPHASTPKRGTSGVAARLEIHMRVAGKDCRLVVTGSEETKTE